MPANNRTLSGGVPPRKAHDQVARSAVVTGTRAARTAGRIPPMKPITSAQITPSSYESGRDMSRKV